MKLTDAKMTKLSGVDSLVRRVTLQRIQYTMDTRYILRVARVMNWSVVILRCAV